MKIFGTFLMIFFNSLISTSDETFSMFFFLIKHTSEYRTFSTSSKLHILFQKLYIMIFFPSRFYYSNSTFEILSSLSSQNPPSHNSHNSYDFLQKNKRCQNFTSVRARIFTFKLKYVNNKKWSFNPSHNILTIYYLSVQVWFTTSKRVVNI